MIKFFENKEVFGSLKKLTGKLIDCRLINQGDGLYYISDGQLSITTDVIEWFAQLNGFFGIDGYGFYFEHECEALLFKMRWL